MWISADNHEISSLPPLLMDHTIQYNWLNFPLVECDCFQTFIIIPVSDYIVFYLSISQRIVTIKHYALALKWSPEFHDFVMPGDGKSMISHSVVWKSHNWARNHVFPILWDIEIHYRHTYNILQDPVSRRTEFSTIVDVVEISSQVSEIRWFLIAPTVYYTGSAGFLFPADLPVEFVKGLPR